MPALSLGDRERGSVLLLAPAAVLVVVVLGAIAVDLSIVFLGEREAVSLAVAAANDAATAALNEDVFREHGTFELDEARARRIVVASLAAASTELEDIEFDITFPTVEGEPAIRVVVRGTVRYVFAPAIPGTPHRAAVEASATAVARPGRRTR